MLEIGTEFSYEGCDWEIAGYVYYGGDMWYVCADEHGDQKDISDQEVLDCL